jgi:hypothetical protein
MDDFVVYAKVYQSDSLKQKGIYGLVVSKDPGIAGCFFPGTIWRSIFGKPCHDKPDIYWRTIEGMPEQEIPSEGIDAICIGTYPNCSGYRAEVKDKAKEVLTKRLEQDEEPWKA